MVLVLLFSEILYEFKGKAYTYAVSIFPLNF
jgi:hypothetical protein